MLYIRSSDLSHLTTKSVYPFTIQPLSIVSLRKEIINLNNLWNLIKLNSNLC